MSTRSKHLMALVCAVCPLCVLRRRWPHTRFSRALRWLERGCPFCRAYAQLQRAHHLHNNSQHDPAL